MTKHPRKITTDKTIHFENWSNDDEAPKGKTFVTPPLPLTCCYTIRVLWESYLIDFVNSRVSREPTSFPSWPLPHLQLARRGNAFEKIPFQTLDFIPLHMPVEKSIRVLTSDEYLDQEHRTINAYGHNHGATRRKPSIEQIHKHSSLKKSNKQTEKTFFGTESNKAAVAGRKKEENVAGLLAQLRETKMRNRVLTIPAVHSSLQRLAQESQTNCFDWVAWSKGPWSIKNY